jgi:hypothetical protein
MGDEEASGTSPQVSADLEESRLSRGEFVTNRDSVNKEVPQMATYVLVGGAWLGG